MLIFADRSQGKFAEAHPLHLRAMEIREGILGADDPHFAISLHKRGQLLTAQVCVFFPSILAQVFKQLSVGVGCGVSAKIFSILCCLAVPLFNLLCSGLSVSKQEGFQKSVASIVLETLLVG